MFVRSSVSSCDYRLIQLVSMLVGVGTVRISQESHCQGVVSLVRFGGKVYW
jgi:hypothetical protein